MHIYMKCNISFTHENNKSGLCGSFRKTCFFVCVEIQTCKENFHKWELVKKLFKAERSLQSSCDLL